MPQPKLPPPRDRDPRPLPEDYPLERVREQLIKAADWFEQALTAHGKDIVAVQVGDTALICATGPKAEVLSRFCEEMELANVEQGPLE